MKRIANLFNCLALIGLGSIYTAQAQTAPVNISGTVAGNSKVIYLQNYGIRTFHVLDSAKVVDGKFSFSRPLKYPEVYGLAVDTSAIAARVGQLHPDEQT